MGQRSSRRHKTAASQTRKQGFDDPANAARLLGACSDIVVVLDDGGVVRDLSIADRALAEKIGSAWIDRPMTETVTVESQDKIRVLLDAPDGRIIRQEINHVLGDSDLPVQYSAIRLAPGGPVAAVGRDLRDIARLQQQLVEANVSAEQTYALHRTAEVQSRVLFQSAVDGIVIANARDGRVLDLNPAAEDMLHRTARSVVGAEFDSLFDDASAPDIRQGFATARAVGHAAWQRLPLRADGHVTAVAWQIRSGAEAQILVRLVPEAAPVGRPAIRFGANWEALRHLPSALVATDTTFRITDVNEAFLQLVGLSRVDEACGQSLAKVLGRSSSDLQALAVSPQEGGDGRRLAASLQSQEGVAIDVEVSGAFLEQQGAQAFCFLLDQRAGLLADRTPLKAADEMTGLVGRMPLREIVRESTDIIEELCIEAALEITKDNRASAAEILGLSRQSLYSKLRRYGMGDLPGESDGADA